MNVLAASRYERIIACYWTSRSLYSVVRKTREARNTVRRCLREAGQLASWILDQKASAYPLRDLARLKGSASWTAARLAQEIGACHVNRHGKGGPRLGKRYPLSGLAA